MPDTEFRYLLLAGLAIALVTAAVTDLRRRQIDNWLNAAVALAAPLYWWATGLSLWPGVAIQIGMAMAVFFGFAIVFGGGGMGGGDVKFAAALGFWLGWPGILLGLFIGFVAGGAISLLLLATGLRGRKDFIPFGPFIALGAWIALLYGKNILAWYFSFLI